MLKELFSKAFATSTANSACTESEEYIGFIPNSNQAETNRAEKSKRNYLYVFINVMWLFSTIVLIVLCWKSIKLEKTTKQEATSAAYTDDYDIEVPNQTTSSNAKDKTFEKYDTPVMKLNTSSEYKNLCAALAKYAGTDSAWIHSDRGVQVVEINGEYVATNSVCNIYWIWTEKSSEDSNISFEDVDIVFCPVMSTDMTNAQSGDIIPEKWVHRSVRLTPEAEDQIGYTCEEMEKIYLNRFNFLSHDVYVNEKFPVQEAIEYALCE